MKPTEKKKKANPSMLSEIWWGFLGLFLGDGSSKIAMALLFLIIGILFLVRPVVDLDGTEIKKRIIPYVIGSVLILLSVILIISWIRKRRSQQKLTDK